MRVHGSDQLPLSRTIAKSFVGQSFASTLCPLHATVVVVQVREKVPFGTGFDNNNNKKNNNNNNKNNNNNNLLVPILRVV